MTKIEVKSNKGESKIYSGPNAIRELMEDALKPGPWYEELWFNICYYCIDVPRDFFRGIKNYFRNLHNFRHILHEYHPWDYHYLLAICKHCLNNSADYFEHYGIENHDMAMKRVAAIRKLVEDISIAWDDDSLLEEQALIRIVPEYLEYEKYKAGDPDAALDFFVDCNKVYNKNKAKIDAAKAEIQKEYEQEILRLLQGQDYQDFVKLNKGKSKKSKHYVKYEDWFDGSGILGWWD